MNDTIHFKIDDFQGRSIICEESQWNNHVVGCRNHKFMAGRESIVIDALQDPDHGIRHYDVDYPKRRCYYKTSKTKDYYTKVVVEFRNKNGSGNGRIITAFTTDSIKPGEKPELPK